MKRKHYLVVSLPEPPKERVVYRCGRCGHEVKAEDVELRLDGVILVPGSVMCSAHPESEMRRTTYEEGPDGY